MIWLVRFDYISMAGCTYLSLVMIVNRLTLMFNPLRSTPVR